MSGGQVEVQKIYTTFLASSPAAYTGIQCHLPKGLQSGKCDTEKIKQLISNGWHRVELYSVRNWTLGDCFA